MFTANVLISSHKTVETASSEELFKHTPSFAVYSHLFCLEDAVIVSSHETTCWSTLDYKIRNKMRLSLAWTLRNFRRTCIAFYKYLFINKIYYEISVRTIKIFNLRSLVYNWVSTLLFENTLNALLKRPTIKPPSVLNDLPF